MSNLNLVEIVGYAASLLVAISLSMKSLLKLRWINFIGSAIFALYGYLIGATPIFIVNAYIAVMNIWYILDYNRCADSFKQEKLELVGETYFKKFYSFYEDDIRSFFPDVPFSALLENETTVLFRNMIPVGIFSLKKTSDKTATILLDYLVPEFRDFRFGSYIYNIKAYQFRDQQIEQLEVLTCNKYHRSYLKKLGFIEEPNQDPSKFLLRKKV